MDQTWGQNVTSLKKLANLMAMKGGKISDIKL